MKDRVLGVGLYITYCVTIVPIISYIAIQTGKVTSNCIKVVIDEISKSN